MKFLRSFSVLFVCLLPINSHALVITDVISVNKTLDLGWRAFDFNITKHGYNHLTDTINFVELSYDFSKMVDQGDDYNNDSTLESIQLNSYIFDGRNYLYDINPGIISERVSWTKNESFCQYEDYDTGTCELNLDLNGTARELLSVYNGNIFLGDVTFLVDVTRANVPEPATGVLLILSLFSFCLRRKLGRRVERN
jgi:hypothetical protein